MTWYFEDLALKSRLTFSTTVPRSLCSMLTLLPVTSSHLSILAAMAEEGGVFSEMTLIWIPLNCCQSKPSGAWILGSPSTHPSKGASTHLSGLIWSAFLLFVSMLSPPEEHAVAN